MRALFVCGLAALAGCQSDAAKFERLNGDAVVAQLIVESDHSAIEKGKPVCPDLTELPPKAYMDSCNKRRYAHLTDLALKQRALNKFMGR